MLSHPDFSRVEVTSCEASGVVYPVLPFGDVPKASGAQTLLELPGPAGLRLLQVDAVHGLLSFLQAADSFGQTRLEISIFTSNTTPPPVCSMTFLTPAAVRQINS